MPHKLGGLRFVCDLRDSTARDVCLTGVYEPQETAVVSTILSNGSTFVDVGANWGFFTLLAANHVGANGRVVSLEPDPRMYDLLAHNVSLNGLNHIATHQLAASDSAGSATLVAFDESGGNFGVSRLVSNRDDAERSSHFTIDTRTLDALLDEERIDTVDLLKMDIEGAEGAALDGLATSMQSGRVLRILLELHPEALESSGRSVHDVMAVLRSFGYRGWTIDHSRDAAQRAHYGRLGHMREWLIAENANDRLDAWPHQLWVQGDTDPRVFDG